MWMYITAGVAISYLIGSIPFGLLLSKCKGIDIRTQGSGNIGATNVFRSVSKPLGLLTFLLDFLKGFIPTFCFPLLVKQCADYHDPNSLFAIGCGIAAIAGHNWSIFMRFTGGKGVATSAGFLLALAPAAIGIGMLAWTILFLASGYVSLASMLAACVVAAFVWIQYARQAEGYPLVVVIILSLLLLLVIGRHKTNIQRLLNGTENRFSVFKRQ